jgi:hypothetical protein
MEIKIYNYYNVQKINCEVWAYSRLMESYYIITNICQTTSRSHEFSQKWQMSFYLNQIIGITSCS